MENNRLDYLRQKVLQLPFSPGVYIMKDKSGEIIYIGKAKALKNRVSSYFRSIDKHTEKVYRMVMHVHDFDYIVTDSEFEALVLECSLIKRHCPKYNILLKDDKGYHYIRIETGEFGKIQWVKQKLSDGADYLGPYTSSYAVRNAVEEANKVFMLPTCSRRFPQDIGKGRPCLNFHIKQCIAPCRGRITPAQYEEIKEEAIRFLKKGSQSTVTQLTAQMNEAAEALDFEKAARYRDRIRSIQKITQHQKVINSKLKEQDVIAVAQNGKKACIVLFKFREGRLVDKKDFMIGEIESLESARSAFLSRYYMNESDIPRQIMIDGEYEDAELILQYIREKAGRKVYITVPQRGEQHKLTEMAKTNAAEMLSLGSARTGKELSALDELARLLGLKEPPAYIEAYDISNIGSSVIVSGMVVFEDARPLKSNYRKFNIKSLSQPDDYSAMRETIQRRIARYLDENFFAAARPHSAGWRKGTCIDHSAGDTAKRAFDSRVRHGQGRQAPHPRHCGGRRGDRDQFPPPRLYAGQPDSGRGAPLHLCVQQQKAHQKLFGILPDAD